MRWKLFTAAALGAVLMCAPTGGNVYAADYTAYEEHEKAIGLIEKCTLTCNATEDGVIYNGKNSGFFRNGGSRIQEYNHTAQR